MSELSLGTLSGLAANSFVVDVAAGSTLDLSAGAVFPAGSILQVVSTTKTDTFTASLGLAVFTPLTGLTATITPASASSKILVMVDIGAISGPSYGDFGAKIYDGTSFIGVGDAAGVRPQVNSGATGTTGTGGTYISNNASFTVEHTPGDTSARTYSVYVSHGTNGTATVYVNRSPNDLDIAVYMRSSSTITLMEVAG